MKDARHIINAWPSYADLALDMGVNYPVVKQWAHRNSIPPAHFESLVAAARRRRISGVTLAALHALKKKEARAA